MVRDLVAKWTLGGGGKPHRTAIFQDFSFDHLLMDSTPSQPRLPQSPPLAGERLAFTGTLASMTHKDAHARTAECGGSAAEHVSRQTTMLVIGEEGWPLEEDGSPSVKLQHVERLRTEGL